MTQFYIIEIKQLPNGDYEHNVYYAYDEDPVTARLKAESKYHEVLSQAAVSENLTHSAIVIDSECFPKLNYSYQHKAPAPTPEPDETAGE